MFYRLREKLFYLVSRHGNRQAKQLFHNLTLRPVDISQGVGTVYYQRKASWKFSNVCTCDLELVEYLEQEQIQGKTIFHFGTGEHHLVALENHKFNSPNTLLAITASIREHQQYIQLCQQNRQLAKFYKVIWGDIYTLTANLLPNFDLVTLFHLGEFYLPEDAAFIHQTDASLLDLFLSKLKPTGQILFYQKSLGWGVTEPLLQTLVEQGKIYLITKYKSLLIYGKTSLRVNGSI